MVSLVIFFLALYNRKRREFDGKKGGNALAKDARDRSEKSLRVTVGTFLKVHRKKFFLFAGVFLLLLLIWRSGPAELQQAFFRLRPLDIAILFLLQLATVLLVNGQWYLVFGALKERRGFKDIVKMNFLGTFFESVTPVVKTGGEVYKVAYLKDKGVSLSRSAALVVTQKVLSFAAFCGLFFASFLAGIAHGVFEAGLFYLPLAFFFVFGLLWLLLLLLVRKHESRPETRKKQDERGRRSLVRFAHAVRPLVREPARFLTPFFLGVVFWLLYAFKTYYLFSAFAVELGYFEAMVTTYSGYVAGLLPFAPGGLGTFEGAAVGVLLLYGVHAATATAVIFSLRLATFWLMLTLASVYTGASLLASRLRRY